MLENNPLHTSLAIPQTTNWTLSNCELGEASLRERQNSSLASSSNYPASSLCLVLLMVLFDPGGNGNRIFISVLLLQLRQRQARKYGYFCDLHAVHFSLQADMEIIDPVSFYQSGTAFSLPVHWDFR